MFKIGDVVRLKSGSPLMTVTQVPNPGDTHVEVTWIPDVPAAMPVRLQAHSDCFDAKEHGFRDALSGIANADPSLHSVADLQLAARNALDGEKL